MLAAVGPMQFEVAVHRMAAEFSTPIALESRPYQVARIVDPAGTEFMDRQVSAEVLTRSDGVILVLFSTPRSGWRASNGTTPTSSSGRLWRRRGRTATCGAADDGSPGHLSISSRTPSDAPSPANRS